LRTSKGKILSSEDLVKNEERSVRSTVLLGDMAAIQLKMLVGSELDPLSKEEAIGNSDYYSERGLPELYREVQFLQNDNLIDLFSRFRPMKEFETQLLKDSNITLVILAMNKAFGEAFGNLEKSNPNGSTLMKHQLRSAQHSKHPAWIEHSALQDPPLSIHKAEFVDDDIPQNISQV